MDGRFRLLNCSRAKGIRHDQKSFRRFCSRPHRFRTSFGPSADGPGGGGCVFELEIATRLLIAVAAGGLLGVNRELHRKSAGFRTHALVCLGAATATATALHTGETSVIDPNAGSRVVQGVLTGIGFLGAGMIQREPGGHVSGLTTAATIWLSAVIGYVCAIASWHLVALVFGLALVTLLLGTPIERLANRLARRHEPKQPPAEKP